MKTSWSLALVAGAGTVLAAPPPAYGDAPPSYGGSWGSSSDAAAVSSSASAPPAYGASSSAAVSSSAAAYSSSVVVVASSSVVIASSAVPSSSGLPSCWTACFEKNKVASEADLCGNDAVSACVHDTCSAADDKAYWTWYDSFCTSTTTPAVPTGPATTPVSPPVETSPVEVPPPAQTSPAEVPPPVETSPVEVPPPAETSPAGGEPPAVVTNTVYETVTVCPCEETPAGGAPGSPAGGSPPAETTPAPPAHSPGEVYTTVFSTVYETTQEGDQGQENTYTYGDWTSIYTSYSLTTTTEIITQTVTHPTYTTSPAESTDTCTDGDGHPTWATQPTGGNGGSPSGSPTGGNGGSPTGYPHGPTSGKPSGTVPPYPSGSGYVPTGTGTASPSGTGSCVPCQGQPGNNPDEWCGYTIHDNWYEVTPKTCRTVEYWWTVTAETISPDGVPVGAILVNGQMPGPMIEANWGDEIVVHVTNGLPQDGSNGTSIHFHGIRQNGTNEMDGVPSITQCPISPGDSMTYRFSATSYGSSWWHSHFAIQTYTGVFGPMIINGPAAAEYDDEQFVIVQDWNHIPVTSLYGPSEIVGNPASGPQTLDTGLINGMNVWEGAEGGKRFEMTVESGKSYRIRLANCAIQSTFVFYVDQHELEVIAMDYVPITPYTTNMVVINIGQRYDLILKANQPSADYWMRSDNQQPCGQLKNLDIKGIVHYADGPNAEPTSQQYEYAPTCLDEPYDKLNPIVPWSAGSAGDTIEETTVIAPYQGTNLYKWTLSGTTFFSQWDAPTLQQVYENGTVPDTSGNLAIEVPNLGEWVYVIIQTPIPLPHPIHLHGHDFLILAQGLGTYDSSVALNLNNPPRRDVAVMPADPTNGQPGYLALAFYTSNPGIWLLHCHIGWHVAMGFALQIIENLDGIAETVKYGGQLEDTCSAWNDYAAAFNIVTSDSGV